MKLRSMLSSCIVVVLLFSLSEMSFAQDGIPGTTMNPNWQRDIDMTNQFQNALMELDFETAAGMIHDGFVINGPGPDDQGDFESIKEFWTQNAEALRDRSMQRVAYSFRVTENPNPDLVGDWVFHWGSYVGTWEHNNKTLVVPYHASFKIVDGKIASQMIYYDNGNVRDSRDQE